MRSSQRREMQRPRLRCVCCCCCCSHWLRLCCFSVKLICCLPRTCSNACNNGNLPSAPCPPPLPFRCASCSWDNDNNLLSYLSFSRSLSLSVCLAMNDTKVSFGNWQSGTKVACLSVCLRAYPLLPACLPWRQSGRCWKYAAVSKNLLEAVAVPTAAAAAKVQQSQR